MVGAACASLLRASECLRVIGLRMTFALLFVAFRFEKGFARNADVV